jgi:hypothetical protein
VLCSGSGLFFSFILIAYVMDKRTNRLTLLPYRRLWFLVLAPPMVAFAFSQAAVWAAQMDTVEPVAILPAPEITIEQPFEHILPTPSVTKENSWDTFLTTRDEDILLTAADIIVIVEGVDWPMDYRGEFLWRIAPYALISAQKNKLLPSVILAQAILETGWGRSGLAVNSNNLFGIKGFGSKKVVHTTTFENVKGESVPRKATFRIFPSWEDSIAYHGELLANDRRYADARGITNWKPYIEKISRRYASSPNYVRRLGELIRRYRLDRWDEEIHSIHHSM